MSSGLSGSTGSSIEGQGIEKERALCAAAHSACLLYTSYADSVDIDGHVYFTAAGLVPAGEFVKVRITGVSDGDLTGEIED